jgi:hypothetical protein
MRTSIFSAALLGVAFLVGVQAGPANAQASRTWVSGVGDDVNPCSRTAPCKTFAGAISKTMAGGEINCLDPGGFGAVTITKAIIISCDTGTAGVLANGTNGITVNAGASDVVFLQGLDIEGFSLNNASPGLIGINFIAGAALHVDRCLIRGFQGGSAVGISFTPNAAGAKMFVRNTYISENGIVASNTGGGILVKPSAAAATAQVVLDNVNVNDNNFGVRSDSTGSAGIHLSTRNSTIAGNATGGVVSVSAPAGGTPSVSMVDAATVSNDGGNGLNANGSGAILMVARSIISGNGTSVATSNGGTLQSYSDNDVLGNTTNTLPGTTPHN